MKDLGQGAFATVEQAKLKQRDGTDGLVAVKRLKKDLVRSSQDVTDFIKEAKLLGRLESP